jgi:hypothetical protein
MVKSEENKGSRAEDVVNVMYQQKEKTQKKNNQKNSQGMKMNKRKKRHGERVTMSCAHK